MKSRLASRFLASAVALVALASPSVKIDWSALAQTANSYITPQKPLLVSSIITSSVNATVLNCSTNPCINGGVVESILAIGSSIAHSVSIYLCTAACPAASNLIGIVSLSSGVGSTLASPVNLLDGVKGIGAGLPRNNNGNYYLNVPAGTFITVSDTTPASASNPLNLTVVGGAY